MSETTGSTGEQPQITEEQLREYLSQLREVPAEQVIAELLTSTLNTAQAKLGRKDARLLIDLSGVLLDHARRYVRRELATQVDQALQQLRLAQVRAEGEAATASGTEPNDLAEVPHPPAETGGTVPAPPRSAPSGLWVPGQG